MQEFIIGLDWLLNNWDIVTLLVTNVGALFVKRPQDWKKD
jgi:hypothetical protein